MSDKRHRNIYVSDASWAEWKRYADSSNISTSTLLEDAVSVYIGQRTSQSIHATELVPELVTAKKQVDNLSKLLRHMIEGTEAMATIKEEKNNIKEKEAQEEQRKANLREAYLQHIRDEIHRTKNLVNREQLQKDLQMYDEYGFEDPINMRDMVIRIEDDMTEVWDI